MTPQSNTFDAAWLAQKIIRPIVCTMVSASLIGLTLVIPLTKIFFDARGRRGVQLKSTCLREEGQEGNDVEGSCEEHVGPLPKQ